MSVPGTHAVGSIDFTGECFVPGQAPARMEADHVARYAFAAAYARGATVLDIACGEGYGSAMLARAGARHVDGVDINAQAVGHARSRYASDAIRFHVGDIYRFESGTQYDLVVSFETIEHVDDPHAALTTLFRVLRPGGRLIVSSPNRPVTSPKALSFEHRPSNPYHVHEFTIDELESALSRHGFLLGPEHVFGQRQQRLFAWGPLNRVYRALFKPKHRADPTVTPVRTLAPRYIVMIADKPHDAVPALDPA